MKKIGIFAVVVVVLVAVIKLGGSFLGPLTGEGDKNGASGQSTIAIEETTEGKKITIEIQNGDETAPPETSAALAEGETQEQPPESSAQTAPAVAPATTAATTTTATTAAETTAPKVYAVSSFSKTMYAAKGVNVRSGYSTDSSVLSSLKAGQEVHATGESENGWIQIDYNGQKAYVYKSYLSTTKPVQETVAQTQPAPATPTPTAPAAPGPTATQPGGGPVTSETIPPSPIS